MPTVVGATMTLRLGWVCRRPCACVVLFCGSSSPQTVSTGFRFLYLSPFRTVFMLSIQVFWFDAVAAADRIAISPVQLGARSQDQSAMAWPMRLKSVWLTKTSYAPGA